MAPTLLNILQYPDPRLRTIADPVEAFDPGLSQFCDNLLATMYEAPGIGLAATQVNVHKRIIAVDVSENHNTPYIFVNPELELHGQTVENEEGCLSVPGFYEQVSRAEQITVTALSPAGDLFTLDAEGLLAVCIQHECDHLMGRLFVDYISSLKRNRIRKKLEKQRKQSA